MYGAILGDIIGSPYEFDRGAKTKNFPLFSRGSHYTDDSVMTVAVAEALMDSMGKAEDEIKKALIGSMRSWGRRYPHAGYGGKFREWLKSENPEPYGSFGNGSAMRVPSAGWLYDTMDKTRKAARLSAEVTHNHKEGIKGAEAVASAIFLARNKKTKKEIREYIEKEFGYDLSRSCDEIRPSYRHNETCLGTIPEAITSFLEGTDFEDVLRTAVSLGGDCDTLTCIAGSIAEAFYGVPETLKAECVSRIPEDMKAVLFRFDKMREKTEAEDDPFAGNKIINKAISVFQRKQDKKSLGEVLEAFRLRMKENGDVIVPVLVPDNAEKNLDPDKVRIGDTVVLDEEIRMKQRSIETADGKKWLCAFTEEAECDKGESTSTLVLPLNELFRGAENMPEEGIVFNPFGEAFFFTKGLFRLLKTGGKIVNNIYFDIGDITDLETDALVNAANPQLLNGSGVNGAIHKAAGPELDKECRKLGGCRTGEAKITGSGNLKAKYVIHTVGPRYVPGKTDCADLLRKCYQSSLDLAKEYGLHSIAFPAISTGVYGYPKEEAALLAFDAVTGWISENEDYGMTVVFSCHDPEMYGYYEKILNAVEKGKD